MKIIKHTVFDVCLRFDLWLDASIVLRHKVERVRHAAVYNPTGRRT